MSYQGQPFATPEEALEHFGIRGMKWGVRKERDLSTESRKERKQSAKNYNAYTWNRAKDQMFIRTMSDQEYKALSTKGRTFAEGKEFRRVTTDPQVTANGALFVSHLMEDSLFYRATMPAFGPQVKMRHSGAGQKAYRKTHYEATLKATKALSSPSEKERVDAYIELMHEPSIFLKDKNAPITGREYLTRNRFERAIYKKYDNKKLALETYYDLTQALGEQGNPLAAAYYKKMQERGYGLLTDDNDRTRLSNDPVIVLDPRSVSKTSVRKLTTDEINQAQRNLRP